MKKILMMAMMALTLAFAAPQQADAKQGHRFYERKGANSEYLFRYYIFDDGTLWTFIYDKTGGLVDSYSTPHYE
nr:hypothetical protein [Clostridia bacterium]